MSSLISWWQLPLGSFIKAKVIAYNNIPTPTPSEESTESTSLVVASTTPTIAQGWPLTAVPTVSTANLSWSSIINTADTGFSPITSYWIFQKISPSVTFTEVASTSSTSIVLTGLTTGSTSTFYVVPVNVNGIGNKSQEVTITIADKPA